MSPRPAVLALFVLLAACGQADATGPLPSRGGVLRYGRYLDSRLLDPVFNDANADIWILSSLYDTLLLPSDNGSGVEPGLAAAWRVAPDGLSVMLWLRQGIRFSDGTPIAAHDVKWSLDRARNPNNGIWNFLLGAIGDVQIIDETTLVLHLRHPDPSILAALSVFNSAILPERQFRAALGATDAEKAVSFQQHPVGSGPFVLQSWVHGSSMRLRRNPFYWQRGADGKPLPYLDAIDFQVIPDDATRILKVQSGELDGAELIPFSRVAELRADPRLRVKLFPSTRVNYVILNVRPTLRGGARNPMASAKVREALNDAVYRRGLIQIVTRGIGTEMTSYMSQATPLHVDVLGAARYDPARARRLLGEAGYAHGFKAELLILAGSEDEIEIGTALQQMWSEVGVTVHLRQLDGGTLTDLYRAGAFAMRLSSWTDDIADPDEITSYFVYAPTNGAQHTGWHDAVAEQLYLASGVELDSARRAADYGHIQALFERGPIVRLFETPYAVVLRRRVMGFRQLPLGNNIFTDTWLAR
ncbi:ABC transporter substrate-binding protein [Lichenicoccus sp.]|uniref:ABC transporter substrate-binding protein n=1 Tax=Lichenicoccus sp. TaxID=2781899 RepID=UPI003D111DD2